MFGEIRGNSESKTDNRSSDKQRLKSKDVYIYIDPNKKRGKGMAARQPEIER